jgi:hypothetical protein
MAGLTQGSASKYNKTAAKQQVELGGAKNDVFEKRVYRNLAERQNMMEGMSYLSSNSAALLSVRLRPRSR